MNDSKRKKLFFQLIHTFPCTHAEKELKRSLLKSLAFLFFLLVCPKQPVRRKMKRTCALVRFLYKPYGRSVITF